MLNNKYHIISKAIMLSAVITSLNISQSCSPSGTAVTDSDYASYPVKTSSLDEMTYSPKGTLFSLWAPSAEAVKVNIYQSGDVTRDFGGLDDASRGSSSMESAATPLLSQSLKRQKDGSWTGTVRKDLMGLFYTFQIMKDGEWLGETPGINAKAVGLGGRRAAVIDMSKTDPQGWNEDKAPILNSTDEIIIYETHHRDFSMDPNAGIRNMGKFLAYTERGTRNSFGASTGTDHLVEMGITHLHILPSFDSDGNEAKDYYNWGYDPLNYNVPEGRYSTDPSDPYARITEFKQMVKALHEAGIRVVLDVVYNHTSTTGDSNFDLTVPGYFYRHNEDGSYSNGSGCGNETASEREMMRRFMVESVKYWITEYHIDGFRFDLMGIHDIETMNQIRSAATQLRPDIFIYGEGWSAGDCQLDTDLLASKANTARMPGISAFGDELRDAIRGPFSDDSKGAFLIGKQGNAESIKFGIVGAINHPDIDYTKVNYSSEPWAEQPTQMISYVSCHDDMCLGDRIKNNMSKFPEAKRIEAQKLAETIVLMSQGVPFIFSGEEILRDKKMVHNSFKSPDSVNTIEWDNKTRYADLYNYLKGLIAIRKTHPAFHMGDADAVRKNLRFIETGTETSLAFQIDGKAAGDSWGKIIVAFNGSTSKPLTLGIDKGSYVVICEKGRIDAMGLRNMTSDKITVAPTSAVILYTE